MRGAQVCYLAPAGLPDVPTFTELGCPQLEAIAWMGLWVKP
jgi:tripartite-type tricarboxylate transporter receptor subunit TctC